MKLSKNSSFVILIFEILKFRNIDRSTFRRSKFGHPLKICNLGNSKHLLFGKFQKFVIWKILKNFLLKILKIFQILQFQKIANPQNFKIWRIIKIP